MHNLILKVFHTKKHRNVEKDRFYRNGKLVPIELKIVPFVYFLVNYSVTY